MRTRSRLWALDSLALSPLPAPLLAPGQSPLLFGQSVTVERSTGIHGTVRQGQAVRYAHVDAYAGIGDRWRGCFFHVGQADRYPPAFPGYPQGLQVAGVGQLTTLDADGRKSPYADLSVPDHPRCYLGQFYAVLAVAGLESGIPWCQPVIYPPEEGQEGPVKAK